MLAVGRSFADLEELRWHLAVASARQLRMHHTDKKDKRRFSVRCCHGKSCTFFASATLVTEIVINDEENEGKPCSEDGVDEDSVEVDLDVQAAADEEYSRMWKIHAICSSHSCEAAPEAQRKKKRSPFDCSMFIQDCINQVIDISIDVQNERIELFARAGRCAA